MNLFTSRGFDSSTFKYAYALCFNTIRLTNFDYKTIDRVGVWRTLPDSNEKNSVDFKIVQYLKKAIRTIPLLSCITYHTHETRIGAGDLLTCYHIVSVSTKRVPADKAMQALFLARSILDGDFTSQLIRLAYQDRPLFDSRGNMLAVLNTPRDWFSEERMLKDSKYFAAFLFFSSCFKPTRNIMGELVVNVANRIMDSNFFSSAACSFYSIKKFYHGGYIFKQQSLHSQNGYIRDSILKRHPELDNTEGFLYRKLTRKANTPSLIFKGGNEQHKARALSLIMSQGEERKHFVRGSFYRPEDFLKKSEDLRSILVLDEERAPQMIERLIDIINESSI